MKVLILKTGKTEDVNDSYGARLIEQGKAVLPAGDKKPAKEAAEEPVKLYKTKRSQKGE